MLDGLVTRASIRQRRTQVPVRLRRIGIQPEALRGTRRSLRRCGPSRRTRCRGSLCTSAESGTMAPRYALPATVRPALLGEVARARHVEPATPRRHGRRAPDTCRALPRAGTGLPSAKHAGHQAATWRRSTMDAGTASPKSSSDLTPYSWIGRSSLTGAMSRVASASVSRRADERADDLARRSRDPAAADPPARAGAFASSRGQPRRIDLNARIRLRRRAADRLPRPRSAPSAGTPRRMPEPWPASSAPAPGTPAATG